VALQPVDPDCEGVRDRLLEDLARRLAAAVGAFQLGVSPEYLYRRHKAGGRPVGDYWRRLAVQLWTDLPGLGSK